MARTFEGRIRRIGNSAGVIIPNEVLEESGAREGDRVRVAIVIRGQDQKRALMKIAGLDKEALGFSRDKRDRI